jgi:simple sugar transport system ATP-binding protein
MLLDLLKAIRQDRRILVFDDPLAALALLDAEQLFRTMRLLAAAGMAIVLKTRHPEAALTVADRIVVLRMGRIAADLDARNTQRGTLTAYLAGRKIERVKPSPRPPGRPVIEMSLVSARGDNAAADLHKVSVNVRAGEITGIAAMPGNGEHTLALVAAGALRPNFGSIRLHGQVPRQYGAAAFARAGVGYVPRDACAEALVPSMSVAENVVLGAIRSKSFSRFGLLRTRAIRSYADKLATGIGVPCSSPTTDLEELSEADRRKLAFWRVINSAPHLIVAHDLASGHDYTTRSELHRQLVAERDDGAAILLISNDIDELLTLSDSIAVLHRGRMSVPQPAEAFDPRRLSLMMSGQGSMAHDWSGWEGAA